MNLSPHFTLEEATRSQTAARLGLDNTPNARQLDNMKRLSIRYLEPFREYVSNAFNADQAIIVSSFYRSLELNRAIGSSDGSDHRKGLAVDFTVQGCTPKESFALMAEFLALTGLEYNQLLYEFNWVHFGIGPRKRHQMKWYQP